MTGKPNGTKHQMKVRTLTVIKITNGKMTIEVTKGAYDSFFAKQEFKVLNNENEEWEENENGEEEHDCE